MTITITHPSDIDGQDTDMDTDMLPEDQTKDFSKQGACPIMRGMQEGWIIPPTKPGRGLPPPEPEFVFECDLSVQEVLEEIRGR